MSMLLSLTQTKQQSRSSIASNSLINVQRRSTLTTTNPADSTPAHENQQTPFLSISQLAASVFIRSDSILPRERPTTLRDVSSFEEEEIELYQEIKRRMSLSLFKVHQFYKMPRI
ncbi:unnamed protein product [Didymodactylos carnosus]|uniref:Uncharacterized protein n=1 Tax=Didymodactylos carnosus TaxID=1234261 RepID=A0A814HNS3_9BILA|nr:unnamed protein product [Didymodactylos carnosus]CAF1416330.1 unnamed protein product [Didymodactylos carnosus]CAF3783976.1 unnamed protein product [Didymodactylos carnosus]CAF4218531.1 unnamed protein product [Didymodactylos carnosus]